MSLLRRQRRRTLPRDPPPSRSLSPAGRRLPDRTRYGPRMPRGYSVQPSARAKTVRLNSNLQRVRETVQPSDSEGFQGRQYAFAMVRALRAIASASRQFSSLSWTNTRRVAQSEGFPPERKFGFGDPRRPAPRGEFVNSRDMTARPSLCVCSTSICPCYLGKRD
jgi:hypothetical protein